MDVEAEFDTWSAGEAYERYMGRWSRRIAEDFVRWLDVAPGLALARWELRDGSAERRHRPDRGAILGLAVDLPGAAWPQPRSTSPIRGSRSPKARPRGCLRKRCHRRHRLRPRAEFRPGSGGRTARDAAGNGTGRPHCLLRLGLSRPIACLRGRVLAGGRRSRSGCRPPARGSPVLDVHRDATEGDPDGVRPLRSKA